MNNVHVKSCLTIGISEKGLLLIPFFIFSLFHKKLLIPWKYISTEEYNKSIFYKHRLLISNHQSIVILITKKQFNRISKHLQA